MIAARLLEVGYGVAKPLGESTRYDLIIEDGDGAFWRVQCKTGWLSGNKETLMFEPLWSKSSVPAPCSDKSEQPVWDKNGRGL